MSGLHQVLPPSVLGQHYANFDALKQNVQDWAVCTKFHFEISNNESFIDAGIIIWIFLAAIGG